MRTVSAGRTISSNLIRSRLRNSPPRECHPSHSDVFNESRTLLSGVGVGEFCHGMRLPEGAHMLFKIGWIRHIKSLRKRQDSKERQGPIAVDESENLTAKLFWRPWRVSAVAESSPSSNFVLTVSSINSDHWERPDCGKRGVRVANWDPSKTLCEKAAGLLKRSYLLMLPRAVDHLRIIRTRFSAALTRAKHIIS